jgi:hypothetical protein
MRSWGIRGSKILRTNTHACVVTRSDARDSAIDIIIAAHVDERRRAIGLISMKNYTCVLHAAYDPQ